MHACVSLGLCIATKYSNTLQLFIRFCLQLVQLVLLGFDVFKCRLLNPDWIYGSTPPEVRKGSNPKKEVGMPNSYPRAFSQGELPPTNEEYGGVVPARRVR